MDDLLWLWIVIGIVVVLAIAVTLVVVSARRSVRQQRERVDAAWAAIQARIATRGELLDALHGKIASTADHEQSALLEVKAARDELQSARDAAVASSAEDRIQGGLRKLLQVAEGYPDLQRDPEFLRLQADLAREGGEIQTSRRHFNGAVREYNTKIRTLPGVLVAKSLGATPEAYFEVTDRAAIAAPPKVQF